MQQSWLVYGTGALAVLGLEQAKSVGLPVILAGRNSSRVVELAGTMDIDYRVSELNGDLRPLMDGIAGVINLAGPYVKTARPLMDACLNSGVHYVDASNEFQVHKTAWSLSDHARSRGVAMVTGAGMGTWFSELLVNELVRSLGRTPDSATLLTLPSGARLKSAGVAASHNVVLSSPGISFQAGREHSVRGVARIRELPVWGGHPSGVIIATGDAMALYRSSNIPNITTMAAIDMDTALLKEAFPSLAAKANQAAVYRPIIESPGLKPIPEFDRVRVKLMAEVVSSDGRSLRGRLLAGSGTVAAAEVAVATALLVSDREFAGTYTAFQILGEYPPLHMTRPSIELLD